MIHRILSHLRGQWLGAIALFIALGGTSYAAVSIPRNSVGTKQLRNRAVTSKKLAKGSVAPKTLKTSAFGGQILFSAQVNPIGRVVNSQPRGATTTRWVNDPTRSAFGGQISWHRAIHRGCFALADPATRIQSQPGVPSAAADLVWGPATTANVVVKLSSQIPVNVAVVCPSP